MAIEMNRCQEETDIPERMTKEKTTLIQKDLQKGTAPNNYRPIKCILTAQFRMEIYYSQISRRLFPEEQSWYHKGTRGTGDLQYIDQHILKESKTRRDDVDWLQKGIWYSPANLDNRLLQNVQDIRQSHKVHREDQENRRVEVIAAGGNNFAEVKI